MVYIFNDLFSIFTIDIICEEKQIIFQGKFNIKEEIKFSFLLKNIDFGNSSDSSINFILNYKYFRK